MGNSIPPLKNNNSDGLQVFVEINPPLPHARISCIDIVNNIPFEISRMHTWAEGSHSWSAADQL